MTSGKKIILVNPPLSPDWDYAQKGMYAPPLGLLLVGTILKDAGFSVQIIDGAYHEDYLAQLEKGLKKESPLFVGISVETTQIPPALSTAQVVRKHAPHAKIVVGGMHPTLFAEQTANDPLIDIVCVNEAEFTCLDLAQALAHGKPLTEVKGIAFKEHGKVRLTTPRPLSDVNAFPNIDFGLVEIENYIVKDYAMVGGKDLEGGPVRRSLPIISSLGCSHKCTFCHNVILNKGWRPKPATRLIAEIEELMQKYQVNDVQLVDELFFIDKRRVLEFLDLIEKKNLKFSWHTNVKASFFRDDYLNVELLKRLRRCGLFHLGMGAESGSQRMLNKIKKGITPEMILRAAAWSKESDINIGFSFMVGLPGETREDIIRTFQLVGQILKVNPNAYVIGPQTFRPYPGSDLHAEAVQLGLQEPTTLRGWAQLYSKEDNYVDMAKMPWISENAFIKICTFYLQKASMPYRPAHAWKRLAAKVVQPLARFRTIAGFYHLPFEFRLYRALSASTTPAAGEIA